MSSSLTATQSDPDSLGTNSIRHTWVPALVGLLPATFLLLWALLGFIGTLDAITHTWDYLLISSCFVFLGAVVLGINYYQTTTSLPKGEPIAGNELDHTIRRVALANDLEFEKYYTMAGIFFFIVTLSVYITYNDVDGNTTYPTGFYYSNVTNISAQLVYSARGTQKYVAAKCTMLLGMLLAFTIIAKYFNTEQGGLIADVYARIRGKEPGYKGFAAKAGSATSRLAGKSAGVQHM